VAVGHLHCSGPAAKRERLLPAITEGFWKSGRTFPDKGGVAEALGKHRYIMEWRRNKGTSLLYNE